MSTHTQNRSAHVHTHRLNAYNWSTFIKKIRLNYIHIQTWIYYYNDRNMHIYIFVAIDSYVNLSFFYALIAAVLYVHGHIAGV